MNTEFINANDKFKRSFGSWMWGSIIVATILHFAIFSLWPTMAATDFSFESGELEAIELPPEIEIPAPPEAISRPATPVIATADIAEDITIAPTTFEDNPVEELPPPPEDEVVDISEKPGFVAFTTAPDMLNEQEVQRALERQYPPLLRDAGIGGRILVYIFIDEDGIVQNALVNQSSGHIALDEAALGVARIARFSPALNRDNRVAVWLSIPITFQVR